MKKNYGVKGSERKAMVGIIGQAVGIEPVYMKMPTCAYAIGNIIVNRTGEMIWDERTDNEAIEKVTKALADAGYTAQGERATEVEEPAEEIPEPVALTVSLPTAQHNGNTLRNLVNLIYTRASLINKALGTSFAAKEGLVDALAGNENLRKVEDFTKVLAAYEAEHGKALTGLLVTAERISFTTLPETSDADSIRAFTELTSMMNKQALTQKRIQAKMVDGENEKYALRIWLTRLGMNGPEYKTTRKILMANLSGHSAFRTDAAKERWIRKQAERREAMEG